MDISELFTHSGICKFSPNGKYIANASGYRLAIRYTESLAIMHLITCSDTIAQVKWSPDSEFVLCTLPKRGAVEVWSMENPAWKCKIEEGPAGVSDARFSPDSAYVLITAEFQIRITVWSIFDNNAQQAHIKHPKFSGRAIDFRSGGEYLALAERRDCKDYVSIIYTPTWELVRHFPVHTRNLENVKWSPDGRFICVWDSCLDNTTCVYDMSGSLLLNFEPYKNALGVKPHGVQWSPSSQLLAIGGFDQKARILNSLTWKPIGEYHHPVNVVPDDYPNCIVFRELEYRSTSESHQKTRYELEDLPVQLKPLKVTNYKKANPKIGVGMLGWSADSQYLFTRNDNMPNVLWIWETRKLSLIAMLIQLEPIKAAVWHPKLPYLALCTGNSKIYTWHVHSTSCVDIPVVTFKVQNIKWNNTGDALMLMDEAAFCLCYISDMGQSEEQLQ